MPPATPSSRSTSTPPDMAGGFSVGLHGDLQTMGARERILATAHQLFYRDGIRATGVDRLIAESGVAKLTFYRHFPAKDALVRVYLEDRHERWMAWLVDALGRHGAGAPGAGLQPLLPAMREWFEAPVFRGCAFINAVAEVADSLPAAMDISRRHKADMLDVIAGLLPDGARDGQARAHAAAVAVDGAIIQAQMNGCEAALAALGQLLDALQPPVEARKAAA